MDQEQLKKWAETWAIRVGKTADLAEFVKVTKSINWEHDKSLQNEARLEAVAAIADKLGIAKKDADYMLRGYDRRTRPQTPRAERTTASKAAGAQAPRGNSHAETAHLAYVAELEKARQTLAHGERLVRESRRKIKELLPQVRISKKVWESLEKAP
jgi:hypothetical protein